LYDANNKVYEKLTLTIARLPLLIIRDICHYVEFLQSILQIHDLRTFLLFGSQFVRDQHGLATSSRFRSDG